MRRDPHRIRAYSVRFAVISTLKVLGGSSAADVCIGAYVEELLQLRRWIPNALDTYMTPLLLLTLCLFVKHSVLTAKFAHYVCGTFLGSMLCPTIESNSGV